MNLLRRQPPSRAKWAYMQELGRLRFIVAMILLYAATTPWAIVLCAAWYDGPVGSVAVIASVCGAFGGWSRGYTEWLLGACAHDRGDLPSSLHGAIP